MKWVVGSVAVLFALALGIAIGWTLRGREVAYYQHLLAPSRSPSPPPLALPPPSMTTTPPITTARRPVWVEDTEVFAWPASASDEVVVVDATHYLVKRAYVVKVTTNNELLSSRAIPAIVDGGVVGVRVFGIRAGSAMAKLGLRNGDTLGTLNGDSLGNPDEALDAYTRARDGKNFVLALERAGAHLDIHYRVID